MNELLDRAGFATAEELNNGFRPAERGRSLLISDHGISCAGNLIELNLVPTFRDEQSNPKNTSDDCEQEPAHRDTDDRN